MALPFGTTGSLAPTFVPARPVSLAVKPPYTLTLFRAVSIRPEVTFARLRYSLGGDRPSQTSRLVLSPYRITARVRGLNSPGWYFTDGSAQADAHASQPPTYPTQESPIINAKLK